MNTFRCDTEELQKMGETLDRIHYLLSAAQKEGRKLHHAIKDEQVWEGDAHLAGVAFLDLVLKYHEAIANGEKDMGPVKDANQKIQDYLERDEEFYDVGWMAYKEVEKIS